MDHSVFSEPEDGSSLAIDTPEKIQEPVSTPVVEEAKEEVEESKEEIVKEETPVVQQIVQEETKQEITDKPVSDVRKKFDELSSNVSVVMKYLHL
ncbi:TPA: hypothetical protein DEP21_03515 [Patescibacteria group bacterium]|nr:hypothetical protein [Candidatus Gracilibacteria bacterium]